MRPEPQQCINAKALQVWRITGSLGSLLFWIVPMVYAVIMVKFKTPWWVLVPMLLIALAATVLAGVILPKIRWRQWRYEIGEQEIELKYGVFVIKRVLIPMVRVQHVNTEQGPFLRKYGLATVTVSTAAGAHEIPALSQEVADAVRDRISALARVADDDV